ncbi:hypothetical protein AOLI_G00048970 [Acnodon oligacanthus]
MVLTYGLSGAAAGTGGGGAVNEDDVILSLPANKREWPSKIQLLFCPEKRRGRREKTRGQMGHPAPVPL